MKKLLPLLLILMAAGCSPKMVAPNLPGTKWKLTDWPGQNIPTTADGTLEFRSATEVSGKSFCNGFGGSYTLTNENIKFGAFMGTKMWCEAVGQAENSYLKMLSMADRARMVNGKLHLMKGDSDLLVFSRAD